MGGNSWQSDPPVASRRSDDLQAVKLAVPRAARGHGFTPSASTHSPSAEDPASPMGSVVAYTNVVRLVVHIS